MSRARTPHRRLLPLLLTCAVAGTATPAVVAPTAASAAIKPGSTGKAVKTLQRKLRISADGAWGKATTRALKRFQRRNGLTATGKLDTQTRQKLGYKVKASSGVKSTGAYSADVVEQVQSQLGVTADGEWGPQSAKALKAWETANGLTPDGVIDADVLTKMGIDATDAAVAPTTPVASENPNAQALVDGARAQIGVPYASGGTTPSGFDCSGLTSYVFKQAGIKLPRTSFDQYKQGTAVPKDAIQAGDLVFFDTAGAGASHVGIATSATTAISATSSGVKEHKIFDSYWGSHYIGAKRVTG